MFFDKAADPAVEGAGSSKSLILDNHPGGRSLNLANIRLARAIGTQVPLATDNVRLQDKTRNRLREAKILRTIGHVIGSGLDPHEVARRVTREAARAVGADSAGIYVEDGHSLRPLAGYRIPKEFLEAIRSTAIAHADASRPGRFSKEPRESLWSDDVPNDPAFRHEIFRAFPVQSIVVTPLQALDDWLGVLVCVWWYRRRRLVPEEVRLLEGIAAQAALALISARLYAKVDAAAVQRERMRMDGILHDMLSQTLFSIGLRLELCLHEVGRSEVRSRLDAIKQDVALAMAQVRQMLAHEPTSAETFSARLQRLIDDFRDATGIPAEFTQHGDPGQLGPSRREVLQKTVEEGLASIAKHGRPRRVTIRFELWTDEVQFELADEGASTVAAVERLSEPPADWGLDPTVDRIKSLGGMIRFWSRLPSGFRLQGTLPLP